MILNELLDGFLFKPSMQVAEPIDGHQFLVSKGRLGVIAQALKTGLRMSIVEVTDKQIELNQLNFQGRTILPIQFACLSFQLLIHILDIIRNKV